MILETIGVIIIIVLVVGFATNAIIDKDKASNKMSFKESMNLTELPVITFYNGNNKLNFLLDTGATLCIINSNIINKLTCTKLDDKGYIYGMEGNTVDVEYISMDITYNNKSFKSMFQIVDMQEAFDKIKQESGVTIHGILGSKFFKEYKYVFDFKELIAYTK